LQGQKNPLVDDVKFNSGHGPDSPSIIRSLYTPAVNMNRENLSLCFVFPMGLEAYPFLGRVEVTSRRWIGKAVYRDAYFEGTTFSIVRCGIGPERAAGAIRNLEACPSVIMCVGTAGSLVEDLRLGDMTVSREIVRGSAADSIIQCDPELVDALVQACRSEGVSPKVVRLATVDAAVMGREDRQRLHRMTGAYAVDMESHAVGMEAARLDAKFACLRVISDDFSSPAVASRTDLRGSWKTPLQIPRRLVAWLRWITFARNFPKVVQSLHPVLVRVIRDRASMKRGRHQ